MQPTTRMRSAATTTHQNKFLRIVTTPYRALCRARDLYVRSVTRCGQPASFAPSKSKYKSNLPRSLSAASPSSISSSLDNEDYRELVRAASVRTLTDNGVEVEMPMLRPRQLRGPQPRGVARSASVGIGMGRIDEEAPFEVEGGGDEVGQSGLGMVSGNGNRKQKKSRGDLLYTRSKSYAVVNRNAAF